MVFAVADVNKVVSIRLIIQGKAPCECLKNLATPKNPPQKELNGYYGMLSFLNNKCIKAPMIKNLCGEKLLCLFLDETEIPNQDITFAKKLKISDSMRYFCKKEFICYNTDIPMGCTWLTSLLIKETIAFINEGKFVSEVEEALKNILAYYDENYQHFKKVTKYKNMSDTYFLEHINPILYYNVKYTQEIRKCFANENSYYPKNFIIIPFIYSDVFKELYINYTIPSGSMQDPEKQKLFL